MGELEEKLKLAEAMGRMRDFLIHLLKDSLQERAGFIYGKIFVRVRDVKKKKEKRRIVQKGKK